MRTMESEREAKEWLARHAVLLGPEELPFEEERLAEALAVRDGQWPVPRPVEHMGVFAEVLDEESFNRVVGDPSNWPVILDRSDLYHSWIVPQAAIIFGQAWFNRVQWKNHIRRGVPFALFTDNERQIAKESGVSLSDTPAGRTIVYKIVSRVEHALDVYLAGGGRSKTDDRIKRPGGYIVESIANEFIQDIGADMGFRLVRVRACPNCLGTRNGRARRSEVQHVQDNLYRCEQCAEATRNLALAIERHQREGTAVPPAILAEHERTSRFCEFSGIACVCPNSACHGRFVPITCVENQDWWLEGGGAAWKAALGLRALKSAQFFRDPPETLLGLPLRCPFCGERFTPAVALAAASGFRGQSGKFTGLPSIFTWVRREARAVDYSRAENTRHARGLSFCDTLADTSCVDPAHRITAGQRVQILSGELALRAQETGDQTAPAIVSRCFYEVVSEWMLEHPEDASNYFFDWSTGERPPTTAEKNRVPDGGVRRTTTVAKGHEAAIHQTILHRWLGRILEHMGGIRRAKGSRIRSIEDLKWFCRPPAYSGGPRATFVSMVDEGLRISNMSRVAATGRAADKPRMAWVFSIRRLLPDGRSGPELVRHMRAFEWQTIMMSQESGLDPGDKVKIVALMMPGHHCHAPIQRIIRLRTSLLSAMIERIRSEEAGGTSDAAFWGEWQKRAEAARKATGIGLESA